MVNTFRYHTRTGDFLRVDYQRTKHGIQMSLNGAVRQFNEVAGLFDFHLSKGQLFNRLRAVL
jgi:hypothetical protein